LSNVVAIAAGYFHSLVLKADGTVVGWGNNQAAQTNVPPGLNEVAAVAAGEWHSLALKRDGTLVVWGDPALTNVPPAATNVVGIAAGYFYCVALKGDGTAVTWCNGPSNSPANLRNLVAVSAGTPDILALAIPLRVDSVTLEGQDVSVGFRTFLGRHYLVEYSAGLNPPAWTPLPGADLVGTGGDVLVVDTNAVMVAPSRWYRLAQE
jgi:hypothetical protein